MKVKIIGAFFMLIFFVSFSYAHQARDVKVSYSHENEILSIKCVHVTNDRNKHYIRRIKILRTKGNPEELYYIRQKHARNIEKNIPLKLNPNESINIEIYCKKGGLVKQSFIVPEIKDQEKDE